MIVTLERYRIVSHDTSSQDVDVSSALVDAQSKVEDELRRPLEQTETTERLPIYCRPFGGYSAYPRRTPVMAVPDGSGYIVGTTARLDGVGGETLDVTIEGWNTYNRDTTSVTFTGGYLGRDDPAADLEVDALPTEIERAIVRVAQGILSNSPAVLEGVKSATVGPVSVTYDGTSGLDAYAPGVTAALRPYAYRPVV